MNLLLLTLVRSTMPPIVWLLALVLHNRDRTVIYQEACNKIEVLGLVHTTVTVPKNGGDRPDLLPLLHACYQLDNFSALWAVEGLGYNYGHHILKRDRHPVGLFNDQDSNTLPAKSLTMLHAGFALACIRFGVLSYNMRNSQGQRQMVKWFLNLCRGNSRPGYLGCAVECLGFAARFRYDGRFVQTLEPIFAELAPDSLPYYWHGVGRGTYFSMLNVVPGIRSACKAATYCLTEPPHTVARCNMISGLAWAMTLVNMRNPAILQTFLKWHGDEICTSDTFANGVSSAVMMREDTTPGYASQFAQRIPITEDDHIRELWTQQVQCPACDAVERHAEIARTGQLETIFRYQPTAVLQGRLP